MMVDLMILEKLVNIGQVLPIQLVLTKIMISPTILALRIMVMEEAGSIAISRWPQIKVLGAKPGQ